MPPRDVALRITRRASRAGVTVPAEVVSGLVTYLDLLGRWNKKINLTALALDPLTDQAIDRLIVEPLVAAARVFPADRLAMDIGSGGGSPAIPLRLAAPHLRMVLVDVKVRKCAFLREVVRELGLGQVEVVTARYEELLTRTDLFRSVDVVTVRAVRAEDKLWTTTCGLLRPGGRVFWFTAGVSSGIGITWSFNILDEVRFSRSSEEKLVIAAAVM